MSPQRHRPPKIKKGLGLQPRLDGSTGNIKSLTGLRFFAAVIVVVHHTLPGWSHSTYTWRVAQFGDLGVTFFFILSGFVLSWSQLGLEKKQTTLRFLKFRFARIYPLHLIFLLITLFAFIAFNATLAGYPGAEKATVISNFLLTQAWIPLHPEIRQGLNGVSWTLSVEFFFIFYLFQYLQEFLNLA
jgi:peptidoglycan/LPS O-acetylase OafA/YrhL